MKDIIKNIINEEIKIGFDSELKVNTINKKIYEHYLKEANNDNGINEKSKIPYALTYLIKKCIEDYTYKVYNSELLYDDGTEVQLYDVAVIFNLSNDAKFYVCLDSDLDFADWYCSDEIGNLNKVLV